MPSFSIIIILSIVFIGFWGICFRQASLTFLFVSLELVAGGIGCLFCLLSFFFFDGYGYLLALSIVTVTAVEAALGLGLLVLYYDIFQTTIANRFVTYLRS